MSISQINMNMTVNKLAHLSKVQHDNVNKGFVDSSNAETELGKQVIKEHESVNDANKDEKLGNNRKHQSEEGKHKKKKSKSADESKEGKSSDEGEHFIDVLI